MQNGQSERRNGMKWKKKWESKQNKKRKGKFTYRGRWPCADGMRFFILLWLRWEHARAFLFHSLSFARLHYLFCVFVCCAPFVNVAKSVLNVRCVKWIYELLNYLLVEPGTDVAEHKNIIAKIHRTAVEHSGAFFALAAEMNYYYWWRRCCVGWRMAKWRKEFNIVYRIGWRCRARGRNRPKSNENMLIYSFVKYGICDEWWWREEIESFLENIDDDY